MSETPTSKSSKKHGKTEKSEKLRKTHAQPSTPATPEPPSSDASLDLSNSSYLEFRRSSARLYPALPAAGTPSERVALAPYVPNAPPFSRIAPLAAAACAALSDQAASLSLPHIQPALVLVGEAGAGKSAFLEALLGLPGLLPPAPTARTLVVHTAHAEKFRAALVSPAALAADASTLSDLADAVKAAFDASPASEDPVVLRVWGPGYLPATFVDTPGLLVDPDDPEAAAHEAAVLRALAAPSAFILAVRPPCVTSLPRTGSDYVLDTIKKADPQLARTAVLTAGLESTLSAAASPRAASDALAAAELAATPARRVLFATLPSRALRTETEHDVAAFDGLLAALDARDRAVFDKLRPDARFAESLGIATAVQYVLGAIKRAHEAAAPRVLAAVRRARRTAEEEAGKKEGGGVCDLREEAVRYELRFLVALSELVRGSGCGCGQTAGEEEEGEEERWAGEGEEKAEQRLQGMEAFGRLLEMFGRVVELKKMSQKVAVVKDTVGSGAGTGAEGKGYGWAAADIARAAAEETMKPLIVQLGRRAGRVFSRLGQYAAEMAGEKKKTCVLFGDFVTEKYTLFIEETCNRVSKECMEELVSTQTVFWDMTHNGFADCAPEIARIEIDEAGAVAERVFNALKARIAQNVVERFYSALVVALKTKLAGYMQKQVIQIQDAQLEELFDAASAKKAFEEEKAQAGVRLKKLEKEEKACILYSQKLSHPEQFAED